MSRIIALSPDAICQIHSSKNITSLQGVVLSLLENSLDAGSSKVEITVDFRRGGCEVEDNGSGIRPAEFLEPDGGLGRMYHTSKRLNVMDYELHGSNGTYLASLGALALLNVSSRHEDHDECASLTVHRGNVIARQVPAPASHELPASKVHGTRVTVRDLFGNMPVRVKQRAFAADAGRDNEKAWLELKRGIVGLLLAWHRPCSVRISDASGDCKALHLFAQHPTVSTSLTTKVLDYHLSGKSRKLDVKDVLPILFQSSFASHESRTKWVPVSAASQRITVNGAICLEPAPTKQCQFLSIGVQPCFTNGGYGDMYEATNKVFTNSGFGSIEDDDSDIDEVEKDRRKRDRRFKRDGFTRHQLHGRKGVDRWPMFVLQVKFHERQRADDVSDASLKAIGEVLDATVRQWLEANHFRPRKRSKRKDGGEQSPATAKNDTTHEDRISSPSSACRTTESVKHSWERTTTESASTSRRVKVLDLSKRPHSADVRLLPSPRLSNGCFSSWSRIKSGREAFYGEFREGKKPATAPEGQLGSKASPTHRSAGTLSLPSVEAGALSMKARDETKGKDSISKVQTARTSCAADTREQQPSSDNFGSIDENEMLVVAESAAPVNEDAFDDLLVAWTDPVTKQAYKVNARTGVVLPATPRLRTTEIAHTTVPGGAMSRLSAAIDTSISSAGRSLLLSRRPVTASEQHDAQWLPSFLKQWNNPVFAPQDQESIPIASFDGPGIDAMEPASKRCTHAARTSYFAEAGVAGTKKLSKTALKEARVIRQVDQKFILCKTQEAGASALLLVDQHAASERVILEELLAELCEPERLQSVSKVKTVVLQKPLHFQIPEGEFRRFEACTQHFADWGILYHLLERTEEAPDLYVGKWKREYTVVVRALPPAIVERCSLIPKLLIELLRSEIWNGTPTKRAASASEPEPVPHQEHPPWLARIGSCPKGIVEMLNSRACRSAIMFNDVLDREQCRQLLGKLSSCAFPFMCAHGRVSMVPLVEIGDALGSGSSSNGGGRDGEDDVEFRESFRIWRNEQAAR